ncbi:hypothetical protein FSARC_9316 [Fusarium sarcochroum]|uniref:Uncharacterized protein n=1 Tax=Fusarium sarcochroum TaxID=1208366 RepID=A0A8H4TR80_9HYPO|nr:hypothetical protein FSARC_9316 [Fusarium sarcochroum]
MRWLAVAALVSCSLLDKTIALDAPPQGPAPTSPARVRALRPLQGIYGRAENPITEDLSITVAPDATCGFYTPNTEFHFTCSLGTRCMWENDKYNLVFCGEKDFKTACMNKNDATDPEKCDEDCRRNSNIQFCTADTRTECFTMHFPKNIKKYPCHTVSGSSSINFPANIESFDTSTLEVAIFPATATTASDEASSAEASTKASSATTARETTTVTSVPQSDGGNDDDGNGGRQKNNTGAIVGGVVGGVAVLVGVCLVIFFIRRRDSKKKRNQPQPQMVDQASAQPQMPYGMAPQQQYMAPYQEWHQAGSPPPQGWQHSPSPPILQHPAAPVLVEAPGANVAQVHEIGTGKTDTTR